MLVARTREPRGARFWRAAMRATFSARPPRQFAFATLMCTNHDFQAASETPAIPSRQIAPLLIVLDLKTTGFSPDRHDIIQVAAARLGPDCTIADLFATYVRPRDRLPWHITMLSGIRNADVAEAPTAPEALQALARFVGNVGATRAGGAAKPVVAAHDGRRLALRFISAACARHVLPMSPVCYVDSLQLARALWPAERIHNLDTVAGRLGIDVNAKGYRQHDARADVRLLSVVVRRMARQLFPAAPMQALEVGTSEHDFIAA